jgi:hypothetical protein
MRLAVLALFLAACATVEDPVGSQRRTAWTQIVGQTEVIRLGGGTLRVEADTPLFRSVEEMELALLTRVAGEAVAAGAPRFAITFVDYEDGGLGLLPDFERPEAGWIGTYADLLEARAQSDLDGSLGGAAGFKSMTAVVRLMEEGEEPGLPAFDSVATYEALLADRIERRGIAPKRRVKLPSLPF